MRGKVDLEASAAGRKSELVELVNRHGGGVSVEGRGHTAQDRDIEIMGVLLHEAAR
jgi:hypothetical protein